MSTTCSYPLFDTHCHLDLPELAGDLTRHWQAAKTAGVAAILIPATEAARWPLLIELAALLRQQPAAPQVALALGIHPWWAESWQPGQLELLDITLQQQPNICAVGEIGLDFATDWHADPTALQQRQLQLFRQQLDIASSHQKPVILHHRKSQPALLAALKAARFQQGGILHAFSGSQAQAHVFLDLGFKLGIGGTITYERALKTRQTVSKLPIDALVLETDAPSIPLCGFQGQVNTPAQLLRVLQALATLRSEPVAELAALLWRNSLAALRLDLLDW